MMDMPITPQHVAVMPSVNVFPVNALYPSCRQTLIEIDMAFKTLPELTGPILMSTISSSAQGAFDVDIPGLGRSSLGSMTLLIAGSGGGKSVVQKAAGQGLRDFENECAEQYRIKLESYRSKIEIWKTTLDAQKQKIKRRVAKGLPVDDVSLQMESHLSKKPIKPRKMQLTYSDATPAAIKDGMAEGWPNITISTDEGSLFFDGHMISEMALFNQAWDGSSIIVNRKDDDVLIKDPRMTLLIQAQEGAMQRFQDKHGDMARDIGLYARFLPVCVPSNHGWRFQEDVDFEFKHLREFHRKTRALLARSIDANGEPVREKRLLKFSPLARELFFELHNEIEAAQQPGAWLSNAKDYAAKITRNLARIAAQLHLIEYGPEIEEISYDTLVRASAVSNFFTHEFLRMFTLPPAIPKPVQDADILHGWMCQVAQKNELRYVLRADVQKYGPYALRKQEVCDAAITVLMQQARITSWTIGRIHYYDLYPAYPQDPVALEFAINQSRAKRKKS